MQPYLTVRQEFCGEYEEKHSRFLALLVPCHSEQEASRILGRVRSKHWDARHNVYAYILKDGASRFSDDGEPHGTAGKPVFDVLTGSGLKDVILIVTRYFGGVLLGTGGLVRAYSSAAKDAVNSAQIVEMCPCIKYSINCDYSEHQRLVRLLIDNGATILNTDFSDSVLLEFTVKEEKEDKFLKVLCENFSAKITAHELERLFSPIPIKNKEEFRSF